MLQRPKEAWSRGGRAFLIPVSQAPNLVTLSRKCRLLKLKVRSHSLHELVFPFDFCFLFSLFIFYFDFRFLYTQFVQE